MAPVHQNGSQKKKLNTRIPSASKEPASPIKIFENKIFTFSQMGRTEKQNLAKIVQKHGGMTSKYLKMGLGYVLITPTSEGEKFRHAQLKSWNVLCRNPAWIFHCVKLRRIIINADPQWFPKASVLSSRLIDCKENTQNRFSSLLDTAFIEAADDFLETFDSDDAKDTAGLNQAFVELEDSFQIDIHDQTTVLCDNDFLLE